MPTRPLVRPRGRNTATVVNVEAEMDSATSPVPLVQASKLLKPSER